MGQLETPINCSEQAIRDMTGESLEKSLGALAKVKATAIVPGTMPRSTRTSLAYENKAVHCCSVPKRRYSSGRGRPPGWRGPVPERRKPEAGHAGESRAGKIRKVGGAPELNVETLSGLTISNGRNELKTLKSRVTVSNATKTINNNLPIDL